MFYGVNCEHFIYSFFDYHVDAGNLEMLRKDYHIKLMNRIME